MQSPTLLHTALWSCSTGIFPATFRFPVKGGVILAWVGFAISCLAVLNLWTTGLTDPGIIPPNPSNARAQPPDGEVICVPHATTSVLCRFCHTFLLPSVLPPNGQNQLCCPEPATEGLSRLSLPRWTWCCDTLLPNVVFSRRSCSVAALLLLPNVFVFVVVSRVFCPPLPDHGLK